MVEIQAIYVHELHPFFEYFISILLFPDSKWVESFVIIKVIDYLLDIWNPSKVDSYLQGLLAWTSPINFSYQNVIRKMKIFTYYNI